MPTEQTSFSVLNIQELCNNPYGQVIFTLWRGSESRKMLESHDSEHFKELGLLVRGGKKLIVNNEENFNIVVFFCCRPLFC